MGFFDWLDPPKKRKRKRVPSKLGVNHLVRFREWVPSRHRLAANGAVIPADAAGVVVKAKGRPRRLLVDWRVQGRPSGWYDPEMLVYIGDG